MGLELYSEIEEIFLDKKVANKLWDEFIKLIKKYDLKNVLDIGCGSGEFCKKLLNENIDVSGIDLSFSQVKKANEKGCNCIVSDICSLNNRFEAAVSIFDVVNYLDKKELKNFFKCIKERIEKYFIFDINTLYAMEELAVGTLKGEDNDRFAVLYSEFEDNIFITNMTLFKKEQNCYKRFDEKIVQYYHSVDEIIEISNMELVEIIDISLYGSEEAEKHILVLKTSD